MGYQSKQIFVNLPVKDLNRSIDFFSQLGFEFNPQFTDENAACMIVGENIYAMLLIEPFFKDFIQTEIADATQSTEVLIGLSAASREEVDELVRKAQAAGIELGYLPCGRRRTIRSITALCTAAASAIWTAIFGSSYTWTKARFISNGDNNALSYP